RESVAALLSPLRGLLLFGFATPLWALFFRRFAVAKRSTPLSPLRGLLFSGPDSQGLRRGLYSVATSRLGCADSTVLATAYASRLGIAGSGQRTAEGGRPHVSIVPQQSLQVPHARIVILERSG